MQLEGLSDFSATSSTSLSSKKIGLITYNNTGGIYDSLVDVNFLTTSITSLPSPFLVPTQSGELKRVILDVTGLSISGVTSASHLVPLSNTLESFCYHSTLSGCMNSLTSQFSLSSGHFSAGSFVTNSTSWNMLDSDVPNSTYTWWFSGADDYPKPVKPARGWNELSFGI